MNDQDLFHVVVVPVMTFFLSKYGDSTHHQRERKKGKGLIYYDEVSISLSHRLKTLCNQQQQQQQAMGTYIEKESTGGGFDLVTARCKHDAPIIMLPSNVLTCEEIGCHLVIITCLKVHLCCVWQRFLDSLASLTGIP